MIYEVLYLLMFTFTQEDNRTLAVSFGSIPGMRSYYCRVLVPDERPRVVQAFRFTTKGTIQFVGPVSAFAYTDCSKDDPNHFEELDDTRGIR